VVESFIDIKLIELPDICWVDNSVQLGISFLEYDRTTVGRDWSCRLYFCIRVESIFKLVIYLLLILRCCMNLWSLLSTVLRLSFWNITLGATVVALGCDQSNLLVVIDGRELSQSIDLSTVLICNPGFSVTFLNVTHYLTFVWIFYFLFVEYMFSFGQLCVSWILPRSYFTFWGP